MYLADHARLTPDKPAMVSADTGQTVTYAQLNERSNRFAQYLYAQGLRRGDHIAVLMENSLFFMEPIWAAFRSGLYVTTINRYLDRLQFSQALFHTLVRIFLAALEFRNLPGQLFVLTTLTGEFRAQGFNLVLQLKQASTYLGAIFGCFTALFGQPCVQTLL